MTHLDLALQRLNVKDLNVDEWSLDNPDGYQRVHSISLVNKISEEFDPVKFGSIIVNKRTDGKYYVVDGATRLDAAKKKGFTTLNCSTTKYPLTREQEARLFFEVNQTRKQVSSFHKFNASVISGEQSAVTLKDICKKYGIIITPTTTHQPRTLQAIHKLTFAYRTLPIDDFEFMLDTLVKLCSEREIPRIFIAGMMYILKKYEKTPELKKRILKVGERNLTIAIIPSNDASCGESMYSRLQSRTDFRLKEKPIKTRPPILQKIDHRLIPPENTTRYYIDKEQDVEIVKLCG